MIQSGGFIVTKSQRMLGSAADIIGPLISGNFLLQAAAQAGGENEDERDEEGDGGGDDDGEEEEDVDCSQAEQAEDAPSSQLTPGEGEQKKKKKRKRSLPAGSNAEAHDLMNKVMILWVGDPIGPNMGEAPTNTRRNHHESSNCFIHHVDHRHDFPAGKLAQQTTSLSLADGLFVSNAQGQAQPADKSVFDPMPQQPVTAYPEV